MRNSFADTVYKIGKSNPLVCVVVADISPAGSIDKFREEFPSRFINTGVAEQSMVGISAGLAISGLRPFCYTIASFSLYRPFEFIRDDLAYQNLPVTVIGMGAGVVYSTLGSTHHTIEDIAISTAIPNMTVLAPCDPFEVKLAIEWCATKSKGPVYMRIGKAGEPNLTKGVSSPFEIGKLRYLEKKSNLAIISYGTIVKTAIELSERLSKQKIEASVVSFHTLKPLDVEGVISLLELHSYVVIIEEHVKIGSLGTSIKDIAFNIGYSGKIQTFCLPDEFISHYGTYDDILKYCNLDAKSIFKEMINNFN
jgi:transketolase